jgi:hypothetical protein
VATAVLLAGSVIAGALGGSFYGFCLAGHRAALRGEVTPANRFLRLMMMRTDRLTFRQALVFLVAIALSLVVFFSAMFTPALLTSWLSIPSGPEVQIAYAAFVCAGFLGWHVGMRLWSRVS